MKIFVQSVHPGGPRFEVLAYDAKTKIGTLKGDYGITFPHSLAKEHLVKYGYKIVKEENHAELTGIQADLKQEYKTAKARGEIGTGSNSSNANRSFPRTSSGAVKGSNK
jgi:hypothetical protein